MLVAMVSTFMISLGPAPLYLPDRSARLDMRDIRLLPIGKQYSDLVRRLLISVFMSSEYRFLCSDWVFSFKMD